MTDYEAIFEQAFKDAKSGSTRSLSDNLRCDRVALAAVVAAAKAEALEEAATELPTFSPDGYGGMKLTDVREWLTKRAEMKRGEA